LVDAHRRPGVDARAPFPCTVAPRVVPELAGPWHGMEPPDLAAGPHVERTHVAARSTRTILRHERADDHEVLVDCRRRSNRELFARPHVGARLQVQDAAVGEAGPGLPTLGIDRDEAAIARAREDGACDDRTR